jgi:hypothetical protein
MQKHVTPAAGRTPDYITNKDWYKLQVTVSELPDGQQHLKIRRWAPEMGWRTTELFLTPDELELFKQSLNG